MYFIVCLLCIIVSTRNALAAIDDGTPPTCCPPGFSLVKISRGLFASDYYDCMLPNATQAPSNTKIEVYAQTAPVYGYRIAVSNGSSAIPHCERPTMLLISGKVEPKLTPRSCLINIDHQVVSVSCPFQDHEVPMPVSVAHKCCPLRYAYDASERKCMPRAENISYDGYESVFAHPVVLVDDHLDCPRDKVLVEYHLQATQLRFDDEQRLTLRGVEGGARQAFKLHEYCIEAIDEMAGEESEQFLVRTCTAVELCKSLPCVRRCCADGEIFAKGNATSYCKKDTTDIDFHSFESLDIRGNFSKPSVFGILRGMDCLKFRLNSDSYAEAHTISAQDGSLYVVSTAKNYTNSQYCVEKVRSAIESDQKLYTFLCFDTKVVENDRIRFKMYPIGLLISCCFYAATLLVYLSIPKLRNLPGQILICLVCSLFTAYLSIALGQLMPTTNDHVCAASGFFIYFCLIAAFAWMNVTCFDIWQTFGTAKKKHGMKEKQTRRFLLYSLYGWGLPTVFTLITFTLAKSDLLSKNIRPHFGHGRCWFTYETLASANLIFFSGPVGVLFLINFVFFTLTLRYCNRVKREIFRMQSSNMEKPILRRRFFMDKARFAMNTKLFVVMGITWFLELLSIIFYDHKKAFLWLISDSFNVLLGVFVFFIFVFKKRVWHSILVKLGLRSRQSFKTTPHTTFATQSTCAQSISMMRLNGPDADLSLLTNAAVRKK